MATRTGAGANDACPSPEELAVLDQVIRRVVRASRLPSEDAADFSQSVHLRLLERRYEPFRRFAGRSALRTFLLVVVRRMLIDWRRAALGKWRPPAAAVRLGPYAVALARLIGRDGHSRSEAIEIVRRRRGAPGVDALTRLADALPVRPPRRMVPVDDMTDIQAPALEDALESRERRQVARRVRRTLAVALRQLPREDRLLLDRRYRRRLTVPAIARELGLEAKPLYGRCDRVLAVLRASLEQAGVTGPSY